MSAPVVSGAAALLHELDSTLTPSQRKSQLMLTAKDLGQNIWSQGAGLLQVDRASRQSVFVSPGNLSFGLVADHQEIWQHTDTLTIYNRSDTERNYRFAINGTEDSGVELQTSPKTVLLPARDSVKVSVTARVDNTIAPYPREKPLDFSGYVKAISAEDTLKISWGFLKVPHLKIRTRFDGMVHLHAHKSDETGNVKSSSFHLSGDSRTIEWEFKDNANYNIIAEFIRPNFRVYSVVFRENVDVARVDSMEIAKDEAVHNVRLQMVDQNGQRFPHYELVGSPQQLTHNTGYTLFRDARVDSFSISHFSDQYTLKGYAYYRTNKANKYHDYNGAYYSFTGLQSDKTVSMDPSNYRSINYYIPEYSNTVDISMSVSSRLVPWHL